MNEVQAVKKVGFFKGLGMMWSSFVAMMVTFFQAGEDLAITAKETTGVLKDNVQAWSEQSKAEHEAEMAQMQAELSRMKLVVKDTGVVAAS
jgi:hypothetical protein